jgi:hypothetical protein
LPAGNALIADCTNAVIIERSPFAKRIAASQQVEFIRTYRGSLHADLKLAVSLLLTQSAGALSLTYDKDLTAHFFSFLPSVRNTPIVSSFARAKGKNAARIRLSGSRR